MREIPRLVGSLLSFEDRKLSALTGRFALLMDGLLVASGALTRLETVTVRVCLGSPMYRVQAFWISGILFVAPRSSTCTTSSWSSRFMILAYV